MFWAWKWSFHGGIVYRGGGNKYRIQVEYNIKVVVEVGTYAWVDAYRKFEVTIVEFDGDKGV